jgi:hypothetical protein
MQPLSTLFTEKSLLRTNTVTDTDTVRIEEGVQGEKKGRRLKPTTVDHLADTLVTRSTTPIDGCTTARSLGSSQRAPFFALLSRAERSGKDPQRLFTWLCESAMN